MASSMGIYVRILSPVVPSSMHQTPGFKSGVWCQATGRLLYSLSCTKDLAWSYGVDVKILSDSCNLAFTKTCHQARLLCQDTAGPLFNPVLVIHPNNHLLGKYVLALTRKINWVSEFCGLWGRRGVWGEGPGVGMGRETELIRGEKIDMEDLEGNINRADAQRTFQAVFFVFNALFSSSKQNSVANSNDTAAYIVKYHISSCILEHI